MSLEEIRSYFKRRIPRNTPLFAAAKLFYKIADSLRARLKLAKCVFFSNLYLCANNHGSKNDTVRPCLGTFSKSHRPLIRWVKGNGKDDEITRSAIGQATKLFKDSVDYCLAINDIDMHRARKILAWATEPVEVIRQTPEHNPELAEHLMRAGCAPENFGYWWKWFPARVRHYAPEWILDGDMVIVSKPPWFDRWAEGYDVVRISKIDLEGSTSIYGQYVDLVDRRKQLYSGLLSIPPGFRYMDRMMSILSQKPLQKGHNGTKDVDEQGCFAAAFNTVNVNTIPLNEFPFAISFQEELDYGHSGRKGEPWGYHFGNAFRRENPHFRRLTSSGKIFWNEDGHSGTESFEWLRNAGQWGIEGYSMTPCHKRIVERVSEAFAGRHVLEIGTSRGYVSAILASRGCMVTTIDGSDRGASLNLEGLGTKLHITEASRFLEKDGLDYSLIFVDLHGNEEHVWKCLWPLLETHLEPGGTMLLYNSHLWMMPEWSDQNGLKWVMETQLDGWDREIFDSPLPGMIRIERGDR
jgi:hypothetical protein